MKPLPLTISLLTIATALTFAGEKKSAESRGDYHPAIDPANFTHVINNPYFPLKPGTTTVFTEKEGRETRENKVTVTHDTKTIMGVKCVVVHDTVSLDGKLVEDTLDWYAQDKEGAVWYFGEATKEFKAGGRVITAGSWVAGVNGQPGVMIVMAGWKLARHPAKPLRVQDVFKTEHCSGVLARYSGEPPNLTL